MTVVTTPKTDANQNNGLLNYRITAQRILELLDLEEEDEYGILRPTAYAIKTAMKLVIDSYDIMGDSFPKGSPSTDEQGSIRLAWENLDSDCRVRLFCPCNAEEKAYVYHQKSDQYGSEDIINFSTLVNWLKWFNEA